MRAFILFVKVGLAAVAAFWLANNPGRVSMDWQGYRIETSVGVLVIALIVIAILLALIWRFWQSLRAAPGQFANSRASSRREKGYRALTQGLVAVAAGDKLEAAKQSKKAKALLNDPPLTMLLSAQSAQLAGDEEAANKYFTAMLDDPQAAFLGVRGLMMQAVKTGDKHEALQLAERAYKLRPDTPWVLTELLDRQVEIEDWDGALKTIDEALRAKALDPAIGKPRKAEILMEKSRIASASENNTDALSLAQQAMKLDSSLIPAVTTTSRLLAEMGKLRKAEKTIEQAWAKTPTTALAQAYDDIALAVEPLEEVKRFQKLAALNPTDIESHIAVAQMALKANLWGEARKQLMPFAVLDDPRPRVCRLMAELEESENKDGELARKWLERASRNEVDAEIVS